MPPAPRLSQPPAPKVPKTAKARGAALLLAASNGDLVTLKQLLRNGASVNFRDADGGTALMAAGMNGQTECVKVLIGAGADVHAKDSLGETAADYSGDYPDVMNVLATAKSNKQSSKGPKATSR